MCVCVCVSVSVSVSVCEWVGGWVVLSFARVRARTRRRKLICSVYGHMHTVSTCVMLRAEVQRVHLKKKKKKLTDKLVWEAGEQQLVASSGGSLCLSCLSFFSKTNIQQNDFHKGALACCASASKTLWKAFYIKAGKLRVITAQQWMKHFIYLSIPLCSSSL